MTLSLDPELERGLIERAHARGVGGKLRRSRVDIGCYGQPNPSRAQLYALNKSNVNGSSEGNKYERPEKPERNVAGDVACVTEKFGHEGLPEETFE